MSENHDLKRRKLELEIQKLEEEHRHRTSNPEDNATYLFMEPVFGEAVPHFIYDIERGVTKNPTDSITIILNSPGGSVLDGFSIIDYIRTLQARGVKVTIKSLGMAASMGGIILQAADERVMGRHSFMMIHEISAGLLGRFKGSELSEQKKMMDKLADKALDLLTEKSTLSKQQIKRRWNKDWWLDADEALSLGLIDRIDD